MFLVRYHYRFGVVVISDEVLKTIHIIVKPCSIFVALIRVKYPTNWTKFSDGSDIKDGRGKHATWKLEGICGTLLEIEGSH